MSKKAERAIATIMQREFEAILKVENSNGYPMHAKLTKINIIAREALKVIEEYRLKFLKPNTLYDQRKEETRSRYKIPHPGIISKDNPLT
jgi:hypothetical protein